MKILMVSPHLPDPSWGASTRSYHLLKALAGEHTVSLVALTNEAESSRTALDEIALLECRKVPLPRAFQRKRIAQLMSIVQGRSRLLDAYRIEAVQQALDALFARNHYDVILFESVFMADYRVPVGVQVIIDQHNIEYELLQRTYQREKSLPRKLYNWWESHQLKPVELERCRNAKCVFVTSEREALLLKALLPYTAIAVIPNGVDVEAFSPIHTIPEVIHRVVFTGSMNYYPNIDAALYFAREIWPLVRADVPDATWYIVGKEPPVEVCALASLPGVTVTGSVSDVKPYMAEAAVAIAPLRIGSGTRLKILEALAMHKGVVSTSQGCEGLAVISGEHLIVADKAELFAQSVVNLLRDESQRAVLANAGRVLVESRYSWKQCGSEALNALKNIAR